jgi:hypothetical protein
VEKTFLAQGTQATNGTQKFSGAFGGQNQPLRTLEIIFLSLFRVGPPQAGKIWAFCTRFDQNIPKTPKISQGASGGLEFPLGGSLKMQ